MLNDNYGSKSRVVPSLGNNHLSGGGGGGGGGGRRQGGDSEPAASTEPELILGKKYPTYRYTDFIARYPTLCVFLSLLPCLVIIIAAMSNNNPIDASMEGFTMQDHPTSKDWNLVQGTLDAWDYLVNLKLVTDQADSTLSQDIPRSIPTYRMYLQMEADESAIAQYLITTTDLGYNTSVLPPREFLMNVLRENMLRFFQTLESQVRGAAFYRDLCLTNGIKESIVPRCVPISTPNTYFFPGDISILSGSEQISVPLDGTGSTFQVPLSDVAKRMSLNPRHSWFFEPTFSTDAMTSTMIRSQFTIGSPLRDAYSREVDTGAMRRYVQEFVVDLDKKLRAVVADKTVTPREVQFGLVKVTWGGEEFTESLVRDRIDAQFWIAPVAAFICLVLLYAHARSAVIAVCALLQLLLTYLTAFSLFALTSETLPLLSAIALFISIAFACDGTMMFYDTFNHSGFMATTGRKNTLSVPQRMAYCFRKAVAGICFAHLVSLVAFASNSMAPFPAVAEFGVMMVVVVLVSMYFFLTLTPAYILFHHYYFSKRRRNLQRQKDVMNRVGQRERDRDFSRFLIGVEQGKKENNEPLFAVMKDEEILVAELSKLDKELKDPTQHVTGVLVDARDAVSSALHDMQINEYRRQHPNWDAEPQESDWREGGELVGGSPAKTEGDGEEASAPARTRLTQQRSRVLEYVSERMVPERSVVHIPVALLFKHPQMVKDVGALVKSIPLARAVSTPEEPLERAPAQPRSFNRSESGDDLNFSPRDGDDEDDFPTTHLGVGSQLQRSIPGANSGTTGRSEDEELTETLPSSPFLRPSSLGFDAFPQEPALWESFNAKYVQIGGVLSLESDSPFAPLPVLVYHVCVGLDSSGTCFHQDTHDFRSRGKGVAAFQSGRLTGPSSDGEKAPVGGPPCDCLHGWWLRRGGVQRQFCCGMFGKRVGESREEKDARIMNKRVKHEGYSRLERFFNNRWAPLIHSLRFPLTLLFVALFAMSAYFTSQLKPSTDVFSLLRHDKMTNKFQDMQRRFGTSATTSCEYCSAYYRPLKEFRGLTAAEASLCASTGYPNQINAYVDRCLRCYGSDECLDCAGVPFGYHIIDDCNVCTVFNSTSYNQCSSCDHVTNRYEPHCTQCALLGKGPPSSGGKDCSLWCNSTNCAIDGGKCNPWTAECECYADWTHGWFESDPADPLKCNRCQSFAFPASAGPGRCRRECNHTTNTLPGVRCGRCVEGRCQNCFYGELGLNCDITDPNYCSGRSWSSQIGGGCTCPTEWNDGMNCATNIRCNFHGVYYSAEEAPEAGCTCIGHWTGPKCEYCKCLNGGTCLPDGSCRCSGAWIGADCGVCPQTCLEHGQCPTAFSPSQYYLDECRAIFCTPQDLVANRTCGACERKATNIFCSQANDGPTVGAKERCEVFSSGCYWHEGDNKCFSKGAPSGVSAAHKYCQNCRGAWSGASCDTCLKPHPDLNCTADGLLLGCDGRVRGVGERYKVMDQCGICGGLNLCVGCDGVIGSGKVFDACGVCGGTCTKASTSRYSKIDIRWAWGNLLPVNFFTIAMGGQKLPHSPLDMIEEPAYQLLLNESCSLLANKPTPSIPQWQAAGNIGKVTRCIFADFATWLTLPSTAMEYGNVSFPLKKGQYSIHQLLYTFAESKGRLSDVVFDRTQFENRVIKVVMITASTQLQLPSEDWEPNAVMKYYDEAEKVAEELAIFSGIEVTQASPMWVDAASRVAATTSFVWPLTLGAVILALLLIVITCSITLAVVAFFNIAGIVFFVEFIVYIAGWPFGPVQMIGMSLLLGLSCEHTVHLVEGYLDSLHASQSHMFARETTSLQSLKQALIRTGRACFSSSLTVICVSMMFLASDVTVFRGAAEFVAMVNAVSVVWTLIFLAAMLTAFGPVTSYRHWSLMVVLTICMAIFAGAIVLIIFLAGGVPGPTGETVLGRPT